MNKVLHILATELEAQPILAALEAKENMSAGLAKLYCGRQHDVLVSGMGPIPAAFAMGWAVRQPYTRWINLGVAGSLQQKFKTGTVLGIEKVFCDPPGFELPTLSNLESGHVRGRLITVPQPVHDEPTKIRLSQQADVVDMEGYALAWSAHMARIPIQICKIVSDECRSGDQHMIRQRIPELMRELWRVWSNKNKE